MGLDIIWATHPKPLTQDDLRPVPNLVINKSTDVDTLTPFLDQRKVPLIASWFRLYIQDVLGIVNDNLQYVIVTPEILEELEQLRASELIAPHHTLATGFFWGTHEESHWDELDEAIQAVKEAWESDPTDVVIYYHWY